MHMHRVSLRLALPLHPLQLRRLACKLGRVLALHLHIALQLRTVQLAQLDPQPPHHALQCLAHSYEGRVFRVSSTPCYLTSSPRSLAPHTPQRNERSCWPS